MGDGGRGYSINAVRAGWALALVDFVQSLLAIALPRTGKTLPNGKPELRFVQGLANRRADETAKCMAAVQ